METAIEATKSKLTRQAEIRQKKVGLALGSISTCINADVKHTAKSKILFTEWLLIASTLCLRPCSVV